MSHTPSDEKISFENNFEVTISFGLFAYMLIMVLDNMQDFSKKTQSKKVYEVNSGLEVHQSYLKFHLRVFYSYFSRRKGS